MRQIGDTLQVDGNGATLQDATRERPRRGEVPVTDETGRDKEHIDLGEDRVIGEAVRVVELTESSSPGEHCDGVATSPGTEYRQGENERISQLARVSHANQ